MIKIDDMQFESLEELAEYKLNEKYSRPMVVDHVQGGNLLDTFFNVVAYDEERPKLMFAAKVNNDGKGIADNYVGRILCSKLSDRIEKNLDSLRGFYFIHSQMEYEAWTLTDPETDLDEYLTEHQEKRYIILFAFSADETDFDFENYYSGLENLLTGLPVSEANVVLYNCDERMLANMEGYFEEKDRIYDDFTSMVSPYRIGKVKFENSRLMATKEEVKELFDNREVEE